MNVPETLPLDAGGAACVNVIGDRVLLVVPQAGAVLTRAEAEELGDVLWAAGAMAEPRRLRVSVSSRMDPTTGVQVPRAKPITCADDDHTHHQ